MAASKKDVAKQQVKEDREKVREMYLSGKTVKEIAKETYFSSSYCYAMVRDLAKEKNLAKKAKRAPLNEAMIQDAKAGMTVAEIAKKHGVTYQQCYYTVSEYTVGAFSWEGLTIGAGRFHCRPVREKWRCGFHGRFG